MMERTHKESMAAALDEALADAIVDAEMFEADDPARRNIAGYLRATRGFVRQEMKPEDRDAK